MGKKKIIFLIIIGLGIGLSIFLVLTNLNSFITSWNRFTDIWKASRLESFFEVYNNKSKTIYDESISEIGTNIGNTIDYFENLKNTSFKDTLLNFLNNLLDFTFNLFIYICNYGLNIFLIFYIGLHETFAGTQLNVKTSPLASLYIKIDKLLAKTKELILSLFKRILSYLSIHRRKIFITILIMLTANGILVRIIVEIIIFILVYINRMINLETYILVFSFFKFIFLISYPYLKYIPIYIWIPLLITLIFLRALSKANLKLDKNHLRLKEFVRDELTQTCFINGCPGTGKTLLNMSLSLATEEIYIEELEERLLNYELKYKYINFAKVRMYPNLYKEHKEYLDTYEILNNRESFIISNYAIYSPLFTSYSKIFNFDYMRVNKPTTIYPLEEYIVITLSEFDKEYNSHDDKKIVGEDGAATFFSTVSHDLKRHAKIFVDYQLRQQVPLRIRGNSEYFITIKDRKKKYPFLLFLFYLPFKTMLNINKHFIKKYELIKKRVDRKSSRYSKASYKRNDINFPYAVLRNIGCTLSKICNWFDQFYYFKLVTTISQEDENDMATKGQKKNLYINIRDLSYKNQRLYDSTFLSYSYEEKKNLEFKDLNTFTKLSPSKEELSLCHSRFYDKINN